MGGFRRGPGMKPEKAQNFGLAMKKLLAYLGRYKLIIVMVFVMAAFTTVLGVISPRLLGMVTDEIFTGVMLMTAGTGGINFDAIARIVMQLVVIHLAAIVFSYVQGYIITGVSMKVMYQLRK